MEIKYLDHVNLRTTQLDKMVEWYETVVGLSKGPRPDFDFPGAWMYAGDNAFVHLIGIDGPEATGAEVPLKLEHFAFRASGAEVFERRLTSRGESFRKVVVADTGMTAFNIWDPDGNHIHVDFPNSE